MSITDRREIEFDGESVAKALNSAMLAGQSFGLPPMRANSVRFDTPRNQLLILYGEGPTARAIPLRAEAAATLLIFYCTRAGFPLPRTAEKRVHIGPRSITLSFRCHFAETPEAHPAEAKAPPPAPVSEWNWVTSR